MVESEEPHSLVRDWLIPWYTNATVWSLTISAVVASQTIANPRLLLGPLPNSESEALLALADTKTVFWPLGAIALLGILTWLLCLRPIKKRKGRKAPKYLMKQFVDEFRSFVLNAASLSAITCYYARSNALLGWALACWIVWAILQWFWLEKNGKSPFDI